MNRPLVELFGPDSSLKKDNETFVVNLRYEFKLWEALCPPDLTQEQAKAVADRVVDVVALPGGFTSGDEDQMGSEMAMMSAALEELVQQGQVDTKCSTKSDLHWKAASCTVLQSIKSLALLMKCCKILSKDSDKVVKNMVHHSRNILHWAR